MRRPMLSVVVVVMMTAAWADVVNCADDPTERHYFRGGSVLAPRGSGWEVRGANVTSLEGGFVEGG